MPLLEVTDMHVAYGGLEVIHGISFSVDRGQVVSLLGSNGAGKTSTLHSITGLNPPSKGRITFDGSDIHSTPAHKISARGLALVPEGRELFPEHTVRENIELGAFHMLRNGKRKEYNESLNELFDLFPRVSERLEQPAGLLSGGEQQMVALTRALVSRPKFLLLDEPSLGLAPQIRRSIFDVFHKLKEQGLSILIVEQAAKLALEVCDYAYVLDKGQIILSGESQELDSNPRMMEAYLGNARLSDN